MYPTRFTHLAAARARFGDRVDRLGPWLSRVDEPADAVVRVIAAMPAGRGWSLFTEAAARGVANVPDAPNEMRALFAETERVPPWVDWPTLDRGGRVLMRAGLLGGLVLGLSSLPHGYASPGGNKPLVFSGRMQEQAPRRLNETARFVQAVCRPGGMRPGADGYQITLRVRLMHAQVRQMLLAGGKWDAGAWGQPINQHDMAATTLLFSLVLLEGLRKLGARVTAEDAEAYVQLWRYTGLVMGVDPEILPTGEAEGRRLADLIRATTAPADADGRTLTRALLAAPVANARSPRERALLARRVEFTKAVCRELVGDELADQLGVARTRWRLTVPILKRVVAAAERIRDSVPGADRTALATGTRYWDRVVEIGLAGATAEFRLPDRLAA
jgi:ER-bound oxygenase mpaB/B'/Rubber oxygenase, catalytic domain